MARSKQNFKKEKLQELMRHEVNSLFRSKFSDPGLQFATITKVELARDFSTAKFYWDTYNPDKKTEVKKAIERVAGAVRSHLAKSMEFRAVPILSFYYDSQFECEGNIDAILREEEKSGRYHKDDESK